MEKIKYHILVVDDDDRIRELVKEYLNENGFTVSTANSAEEAKIRLNYFKFNLLILDVMMPGQNGFELTKEIKKILDVPVMLLTAKGEVEDRILGLELGADDYLGKPFEPKELLLRIKNIIKKTSKIDFNKTNKIGSAKIDLNKMSIQLKNKSNKINNAEKKVLLEMLANPGKTYSRSQIGEISNISQERSIDVMITRLRQKIEINPKNPKYLQTIRGSGYVLWIKQFFKKNFTLRIILQIINNCSCTNCYFTDCSNLNSKYKDSTFDLLSIDVEGHELEVLKGFDLTKFSPKVIVIEYLDLNVSKLEIKNLNIEEILNTEIYKYLTSRNYILVNSIYSDLVFVNKKFRD